MFRKSTEQHAEFLAGALSYEEGRTQLLSKLGKEQTNTGAPSLDLPIVQVIQIDLRQSEQQPSIPTNVPCILPSLMIYWRKILVVPPT